MFLNKRRITDKVSRQMQRRLELLSEKRRKYGLNSCVKHTPKPTLPTAEKKSEPEIAETIEETTTTTVIVKPKKIKKENN